MAIPLPDLNITPPPGEITEQMVREKLAGVERDLRLLNEIYPYNTEGFQAFPQARVFNSAAIPAPNNTLTTLTFNSERWDTGAPAEHHSTSANTSRLTCRIPGLYHIYAHSNWAALTTGGSRRLLDILLNGIQAIGLQDGARSAGGAAAQSVSTEWRLNVGDYVEAAVLQDSGGALNVTATAAYSPELGFSWRSR